MASDNRIVDESLIGDPKERPQEQPKVVCNNDCSTEEALKLAQQPAASPKDEVLFKTYIVTPEHELPIIIENNVNSRIVNVNIIAYDKHINDDASNVASSNASNVAALNININIVDNNGLVVISSNGEVNFNVKPNDVIERPKPVIQDRKGISKDLQPTTFVETFDWTPSN